MNKKIKCFALMIIFLFGCFGSSFSNYAAKIDWKVEINNYEFTYAGRTLTPKVKVIMNSDDYYDIFDKYKDDDYVKLKSSEYKVKYSKGDFFAG